MGLVWGGRTGPPKCRAGTRGLGWCAWARRKMRVHGARRARHGRARTDTASVCWRDASGFIVATLRDLT
nr:hypothetical protein RVX_1577 [Nitratidesulfovibrio sp. HK-II]